MNKVKVTFNKKLNEKERQILKQFNNLQTAMIEKDEKALNNLIRDNYHLTHMSGRKQTKEDFIEEILNNTLNYYESKIENPEIKIQENHAQLIADITLVAKVYGMKGVWTLHSIAEFENINGNWLIVKWEN